jgi:hypothetical protein
VWQDGGAMHLARLLENDSDKVVPFLQAIDVSANQIGNPGVEVRLMEKMWLRLPASAAFNWIPQDSA